MKQIICLLIVMSLSLFSACSTEEKSVAQKFGTELTMEESTTLAAVYANPDQYDGKEIRLEGTITQVCQTKGCWLRMTDGTNMLTVKFKDYGFFVPKDAANSRVVIQGTFHTEMDDHAEHVAEEAEAQKAEQETEKAMAAEKEVKSETEEAPSYSFTASGVEIFMPEKAEKPAEDS